LGQRFKWRVFWNLLVDGAKLSMKTKRSGNRIDTTLGELIAAVSEAAFEYTDNRKEAYHCARLAVVAILKGASLSGDRRLAAARRSRE
jgi:hypothetical protein